MTLIRKIWNNFCSQPDVWFFYAFLATFTLTIRKVLSYYPIHDRFNEYSGIYLYLSDIFLLLTITAWILSIFKHKYTNLSIFSTSRVPRGTLLLSFSLVLWSFTSIYWSSNQNISIFRSFKLLEFLLLFLYIIAKIVPRPPRIDELSPRVEAGETILRNSLQIIIVSAVFQSIIGICQFIAQQSIGLFWLKESLIGPDILGVAKIILHGEKFIRSYGLFPHPNVFGGFLLFSIILTYAYHKMFHVEHLKIAGIKKCSTWNSIYCKTSHQLDDVPRGTFSLNLSWPLRIIFSIQLMALFLTFSKSAIIGLVLSSVFIFIKPLVPRPPRIDELSPRVEAGGTKFGQIISEEIKIVPRGTILIKRALLILFIGLALLVIFKPDIYSLFFKSLDERLIYINVSRGTILDNLFFGLGMGQFVINMQTYANLQLLGWQFQPVHNVFLLIWSELGIVGLVLFIFILWRLFHVEQLDGINDVKCSTPASHRRAVSASRGGWNNNNCEICAPTKNVPRPPCIDEMSSRVEAGGTIEKNRIISIASRGLLFGILFIMLFDHYFWTIQQGQIIFWVVVALAYSQRKAK